MNERNRLKFYRFRNSVAAEQPQASHDTFIVQHGEIIAQMNRENLITRLGFTKCSCDVIDVRFKEVSPVPFADIKVQLGVTLAEMTDFAVRDAFDAILNAAQEQRKHDHHPEQHQQEVLDREEG